MPAARGTVEALGRWPDVAWRARAWSRSQALRLESFSKTLSWRCGRMSGASPQRLGDFEIAREIGRGGMGVVCEALQVSLNRRVALKVLSGGLGLTPNAVQRFRREAEAAAKLHHTNIVPVYATDEQ